MKYRKKSVVIDAVQWHGKLTDLTEWPDWFRTALEDSEDNPTLYLDAATMYPKQMLCVATLEGTMRANPGDWIIRGVKGEIYPCKPDIFEASYEAATQARQDTLNMTAVAVVTGYDYNLGDSDLDDEQPIHVRMTLGDWRRANGAVFVRKSEAAK